MGGTAQLQEASTDGIRTFSSCLATHSRCYDGTEEDTRIREHYGQTEGKALRAHRTPSATGSAGVAALTGLDEKAIRLAIRQGELIACYAGSSTKRIRRRDLDDWISSLPERPQ